MPRRESRRHPRSRRDHARAFDGIRQAWERYDNVRKGEPIAIPAPAVTVQGRPLAVQIASGKSHASIWGKAVTSMKDIPQPARGLFEQIAGIEGIGKIRLTTKTQGPSGPGVRASGRGGDGE